MKSPIVDVANLVLSIIAGACMVIWSWREEYLISVLFMIVLVLLRVEAAIRARLT